MTTERWLPTGARCGTCEWALQRPSEHSTLAVDVENSKVWQYEHLTLVRSAVMNRSSFVGCSKSAEVRADKEWSKETKNGDPTTGSWDAEGP